MKKIFAIIIVLFSFQAFAEDTCTYKSDAESSAVEKLIQKLNERDLTIKEISEENLNLLVDKIHLDNIRYALEKEVITLKQANKELRASLTKTNATLAQYKMKAVKYTNVVYKKTSDSALQAKKDSVKAARNAIKAIDAYLSTVQ